MRPGLLIMIGTFSIVIGLVPPIGILCVASGVACVGFGISALYREANEELEDEEDNAD